MNYQIGVTQGTHSLRGVIGIDSEAVSVSIFSSFKPPIFFLQELAEQYEVAGIPMFIFFKGGEKVCPILLLILFRIFYLIIVFLGEKIALMILLYH